jgi:hypothetical protein
MNNTNKTPKMTKQNTTFAVQIAYWNANSVKNKKNELIEFIDENKIDIMLLGETWLRTGDNFKIPNYVIYRNDRLDQPGGGTAVCVKKNLKHDVLPSANSQIENTAINLYLTDSVIRIVSAYCPPGKILTSPDLDAIFSDETPTLVLGDLNAKHQFWNCNSTNNSGRALLNYTRLNAVLTHVPTSPTHYGQVGRPDILDIGLSKNLLHNIELTVHQDLSSDHNPISLTLSNADPLRKEILISKTNWTLFKTLLIHESASIKQLMTTTEINNEVSILTAEISNAYDQSTTTEEVTLHKPYQLPNGLRNELRESRRLKKIAQRTLNPQDIAAANRASRQLKTKLRDFHQTRWSNKIESMNEDHTSVWKLVKSLKPKSDHPTPIHGRQGIVHTAEEKAEAFADSIEAQCMTNPSLDEDTDNNVKRRLREYVHPEHAQPLPHATLPELMTLIKNIKPKKAPGKDRITNLTLKNLPKKSYVKLLNIINACLRIGYFPQQWREAVIITIPKPGKNPLFPQNHRPISLLSHVSKLLERIILSRLLQEIEENKLLPDEQYGFRHSHNTDLQTLRLTEIITAGFEHKDTTVMVLLDVEKAFDKVWHCGLLYKLLEAKIHPLLYKIIKSFLTHRSFRVRVEDTLSSARPIQAGVPQGSVLGPILYNLYTRDFPRRNGTQVCLFADDTALIATSRDPKLAVKNTGALLNDFCSWFESWRIRINIDKTQAIAFNTKISNPENIHLLGQPIEWSQAVKYLGINFDRRLTWKHHTTTMKQRGQALLGALRPILRAKELNLKIKRQLYLTLIRSAITFGIPTYTFTSKTNLQKLQVVQNKALRAITGAPWFVSNRQLHRELSIQYINEFKQDRTKAIYQKAKTHTNPTIRDVTNYTQADVLPRSRRPQITIL